MGCLKKDTLSLKNNYAVGIPAFFENEKQEQFVFAFQQHKQGHTLNLLTSGEKDNNNIESDEQFILRVIQNKTPENSQEIQRKIVNETYFQK